MNKTTPVFFVKDSNAKNRLIATHTSDGTGVYLNDEFGTTRVGVAPFSHGGGGVALYGENSNGVAVLYFKQQGSLIFLTRKVKFQIRF